MAIYDDNDMSEGEYLGWQYEDDVYAHEERLDNLQNKYCNLLSELQKRMVEAKRAEVGATIKCAQCEKAIVKRSYQKVFCSNAKTHGKHNCKDKYHNRIAGLKKHLKSVNIQMYELEDEVDVYGNRLF